MIIGKGMIANAFNLYKHRDDVVVFASGVSDSNESDELKFLREKELLKSYLREYNNKQFIYFSSCSLEDEELQNTPYHIHKQVIETLIKEMSTNYLIFRLPNIIGHFGNENTLVNFLMNKIKSNEELIIWKNATRNIVDIEDLYKIVSYIIDKKHFTNSVINIAYNTNVKIIDLVNIIEIILNKKAIYKIADKGFDMRINNDMIKPIMNQLLIKQPSIKTLINKYKEE